MNNEHRGREMHMCYNNSTLENDKVDRPFIDESQGHRVKVSGCRLLDNYYVGFRDYSYHCCRKILFYT